MTIVEYSVLLLCLPLTWALTSWRIGHAQNRDLLAVPNHRSSHTLPTPTSGGWGFVIVMYGYLAFVIGVDRQDSLWLGIMLGLALPVAVVGYIDDRGHLAAAVRLAVHFAVAIALVVAMRRSPELLLPGFAWMPGVALGVCYVIALVWLLNLFNFMDGIDGIAGVEAITALLGAALILWLNGHTLWQHALLALASCVAGFLVLNWPPAKIFMGDVGSGFLGFLLGALALMTAATGTISLWSWTILLAVFVADTAVTLARRALRRQRIYEAHRSHAYQIMTRHWQSHRRVTLTVLAINLLWLLPLAWLASAWREYAALIALCAYLPLVLAAVCVGAGATDE